MGIHIHVLGVVTLVLVVALAAAVHGSSARMAFEGEVPAGSETMAVAGLY